MKPTIPSFFIAHGAPSLALEENDYTLFLSQLHQRFQKPKAIILFSAHWENPVQKVSSVKEYTTIHDFYGFPKSLYDIHYPAKGCISVTEKVEQLLQEKGIMAERDMERGLDHGAWVILRLMYPHADIPVISMSVNPQLKPSEQYQIGQALSDLREENVLIIGSGGTVHNLRAVKFGSPPEQVDDWALEFDEWLKTHLEKWDLDALFEYRGSAPHVELAVPQYGVEHFIPLFYAMGAAGNQEKAQLLFRHYTYGNLSHCVWQFG